MSTYTVINKIQLLNDHEQLSFFWNYLYIITISIMLLGVTIAVSIKRSISNQVTNGLA